MTTDAELGAENLRCGRIKLLVALQGLFGIFYLGYAAYCFHLYGVSTSDIYHQRYSAEAIHTLRFDAVLTVILGSLSLASALGLRRGRLWAYKTAGALAWFFVCGTAISLFTEKPRDWDMLWLLIPYVPLLILFVLPGTRAQLDILGRR